MAKTIRIAASFTPNEKKELETFSTKKAIPRTELMRRATLAFIRHFNGDERPILELFSEVGFTDKLEELNNEKEFHN